MIEVDVGSLSGFRYVRAAASSSPWSASSYTLQVNKPFRRKSDAFEKADGQLDRLQKMLD